MKMLFILPYDNTYRRKGGFTRSISYAPLTLAVLAALVPDSLQAEIKIIDEGVDKPLNNGMYDIVCITCVTSSANRAYELCKFWKNRGSYVCLGGAYPTLMPGEAGKYADSIFIGFGERTFPEFLNDFIYNSPKKIYRHECSNSGEYLPMPIPRRDLLSKKYMNIPTIVANRGCKNNCSYCSIHKMWGNDGFARPVGEVIDEIKRLRAKKYILLDPSLSSDREYAKEF